MVGAAVYRGFSQAQLDDEYNPRLKEPNFQSYFDRWGKESEAARASRSAKLDIAYGPGATDKLDIFAPDRAGPHPVLVYFHGGYWRRFSKNDRAFIAPHIAATGVMMVSVDYALCPAVTMDELIAQCRRAVVWAHRHIAEHGGDPNRIFVAGESAGGHIVAMMAGTDWAAEKVSPAPVIRGALAISGVYELEPIRLSYLQPDLHLTPEQVERNSPIRQVRKSPTQVILAVGLDESAEFQRQMNAYSEAFAQAGIRHDVVRCGGRNHFSIVDALCEPRHMLHLSLMRLMRP
jgi:arylformamidase